MNLELLLALQWGPSKGIGSRKTFSVHGGWPQNVAKWIKQQRPPPTPIPFNYSTDIVDTQLRADLVIYWPSLESYGNTSAYEAFWETQWRKHDCGYLGMQPEQYFQKMVDLVKQLPQDLGLQVNTQIKVKDVIASIRTLINVDVEVNGRFEKGRCIIQEIRILVDHQGNFKDRKNKPFSGDIKSVEDYVVLPA